MIKFTILDEQIATAQWLIKHSIANVELPMYKYLIPKLFKQNNFAIENFYKTIVSEMGLPLAKNFLGIGYWVSGIGYWVLGIGTLGICPIPTRWYTKR